MLQRVSQAQVVSDGELTGAIGRGLLIFLGIEMEDGGEDISWLVRKITNLRVFPDGEGVMNRSLSEVGGDALLVSQFTLHASTRKGNRPSYARAAAADRAEPLYTEFRRLLSAELGREVPSGVFGADMNVSLINDGPVTIWIDTKNRE